MKKPRHFLIFGNGKRAVLKDKASYWCKTTEMCKTLYLSTKKLSPEEKCSQRTNTNKRYVNTTERFTDLGKLNFPMVVQF